MAMCITHSSLARARLATLGLLAALLTGCAGGAATRVAADEVLREVDAGADVTIVDVRTRGEYEAGHVPGAVHLPFYAIWTRHSELGLGKDEAIVVYCSHGPRAGLARFGFETAGYAHVRSMEGHMVAWRERGYPMETGAP